MLIDRRQSERYDILLNVEFKPFKETISDCHGVTDNISCGGLSIGSQHCDFKSGEIMELRLKHPQSELSFSVEGKIVWNKEAWYKSVTGIEFEDIDKDCRKGLAEFISRVRDSNEELFHFGTKEDIADNSKVENDSDEETAVGQKDELIREIFREDIDAELNESEKGGIPIAEGSPVTSSTIEGFVNEVINEVESGGKTGSPATDARAKDPGKRGRLHIVLPAVFIVVSAIVLLVNYESIKQGVMNITLTTKSIPSRDTANKQPLVIADNAQPDNLKKVEDRFTAENITVNIGFSRNSVVVESLFYPEIDRITDLLLRYTETSVRLAGHTDNVGPGIYNVNLSANRAAAVKDLLVGRGVAASRIETEGLGDSSPVSSNDTWSGRAGNRRVEIEIVPAD
jgi:outer membrane protein OmpA-like peptidoglycan-associated protein